eukprot:Nk52_evm96s217 gene=Nk52_evmTU96s217
MTTKGSLLFLSLGLLLCLITIQACEANTHHALHLEQVTTSSSGGEEAVENEKSKTPLPVVMWHGMGDNCCSKNSMGKIKKFIEENLPGVYIVSLMIGENPEKDSKNSFFMPVNDQIDAVCKQLEDDPKLKDTEINVIGFSQGAQFLRAYVERCNSPKVRNMISIGGQHEGVFGIPNCVGKHSGWCNFTKKLIEMGAYKSFVQNRVVQAQYWHDPLNEKEYVKNSVFLADINNEKSINPNYKANMLSLNRFVMVKFSKDTYVDPHESEWFGFYRSGQKKEIEPFTERPLYKEDRLGLKQLNEEGKIVLLEVDGDHLQFGLDWLKSEIIDKFFK